MRIKILLSVFKQTKEEYALLVKNWEAISRNEGPDTFCKKFHDKSAFQNLGNSSKLEKNFKNFLYSSLPNGPLIILIPIPHLGNLDKK